MEQRIGSYPIVRKLGEGGMGRIFLVRDTEDGSLWAAKQYKGDMTRPLFVQRFRREFRALQSLNHPAIVRVRNMEFTDNLMFFLMEYVSGRPFDRVLNQPREYGTEWIRQVLHWMRYLCDPLEYIHQHRMIHRDLKPGNLMIMGPGSDPPVKLLDFGVIHWLHADSVSTATPTFMGSLRYMAPEQMNSGGIDLRSDLYSLGIIMYEAVTGQPPFAVDNPLLLMSLHQTGAPPPPQRYNPNVSDPLQNLILTLLSKRPDDRPSSAREVAEWIDRILEGDSFVPVDPRKSVFLTGMLFTPELCGREPEIRKLRDMYQLCCNNTMRVMTVHGSTGIGKSRLLTQFQRLPETSQQIVFHGEFQKNGPIHNGLIYALRRGRESSKKRHLMQSTASYETIDALNAAIKQAILMLEGSTGAHSDPVNIKQIAAGIAQLLSRISTDQPAILILDDLHYARAGDLNLLKNLIQFYEIQNLNDRNHGFCIILGYRDEPGMITRNLAAFLDWMDAREIRVDLPLKGLNKISVNRMITSMLGGLSAPVLGVSVYEDSDGNPLHIVEIIRELIENQPDPIWNRLGQNEDSLTIPSPARITQIMGRRIDRFSEDVREVINAGAVLGASFRADELERLCDLPDDTFLDQVDQLLRQRIIEEDPFRPETYRFSHQKLQEAVYAKIPPDEIRTLHAKAISVLESLHVDHLARAASRLVFHAERIDDLNKTYDYSILASKHADALGDQVDAQDHLQRAITLLDKLTLPPGGRDRRYLETNVSLASLVRRSGNTIKASQILQDITVLSEKIGDNLLHAQIQKQLGAIWGHQGRIDQAVSATASSIAVFEREGCHSDVIDCYVNLGASYNYVRNYEKARENHRIAMEKAQIENDEYRLAMSMINLGMTFASEWKGPKAIPYLERGRQIAEKIQSKRLISYALMGLASAYLSPELIDTHAERAIDLTDQVMDLSRQTGDISSLVDSLYKRSMACNHLGRLNLDDLDRAISLASQFGQHTYAQGVIQYKEMITSQVVSQKNGSGNESRDASSGNDFR
ncbi:protein kinase [bacterium]|nr:protein kinase [candidate division CSSED10-310 bacterium]